MGHSSMKLYTMYEQNSFPMTDATSQYCLRWHNHRSNLLSAFETLLDDTNFTDVTLVCESGEVLHAHRIVLAASSAYFEKIFSNFSNVKTAQNPVIVLKDVQLGHMKALLCYMYKGEVNVQHSSIEKLIRVARELQVKGLVNDLPFTNHMASQAAPVQSDYIPKIIEHHNTTRSKHSSESTSSPSPTSKITESSNERGEDLRPSSRSHLSPLHPSLPFHPYFNPHLLQPRESPRDSSSDRLSMALQESMRESSLPLLTPLHSRAVSPSHKRSRSHISPPPILRNALAHTHGIRPDVLVSLANSMMPLPPLLNACPPRPILPPPTALHFPIHDQERKSRELKAAYEAHQSAYNLIHPKKEEPSEDEEEIRSNSDGSRDGEHNEKVNDAVLPDFPNYGMDSNAASHFSNFVSYVPTPKPEWKRYKQYTKDDLQDAIDAVIRGMSALQASRKYKVPSRTLYDKIKKMGIITIPRRVPIKRSSPSGIDSTSDTPIPLLDIRPHSVGSFDQRPSSDSFNIRPSSLEVHASASGYSSFQEHPTEKERSDGSIAEPGTTRGSFALVERNMFDPSEAGPLDLTDSLMSNRQIEERA